MLRLSLASVRTFTRAIRRQEPSNASHLSLSFSLSLHHTHHLRCVCGRLEDPALLIYFSIRPQSTNLSSE
jgi:hypothetical protein